MYWFLKRLQLIRYLFNSLERTAAVAAAAVAAAERGG